MEVPIPSTVLWRTWIDWIILTKWYLVPRKAPSSQMLTKDPSSICKSKNLDLLHTSPSPGVGGGNCQVARLASLPLLSCLRLAISNSSSCGLWSNRLSVTICDHWSVSKSSCLSVLWHNHGCLLLDQTFKSFLLSPQGGQVCLLLHTPSNTQCENFSWTDGNYDELFLNYLPWFSMLHTCIKENRPGCAIQVSELGAPQPGETYQVTLERCITLSIG